MALFFISVLYFGAEMKHNLFFVCILCSIFLFSCSLDYGNQSAQDKKILPEMILKDANFVRIEKLNETTALHAETLEIFKEDNVVFGSNVNFKAFDKNKKTIATGRTDLLKIDNRNFCYTMLNNANIKSIQTGMTLYSDCFKWNSKTNQLVSGKDNVVTVIKEPEKAGDAKFSASGTGFVFSGLSLQFAFNGKTTGKIEN